MNTKSIAEWYDNKYTEMNGGWKIGQDEALRLIEWAEFGHAFKYILLDIGCGDGDFVSYISDKFWCIGIDLSEVGIKYASDRGIKSSMFEVADIETLDYPNGYFDYLTSIGSIEHVENIDRALKSCFDLLIEGGKFLCMVPNELWIHKDQPSEQTHTDEEWTELFKKAGFKVLKVNRRNDLTDFLLTK